MKTPKRKTWDMRESMARRSQQERCRRKKEHRKNEGKTGRSLRMDTTEHIVRNTEK